ncbi:MAG: glutamate racemase [candidate division Zixibacteria bacterium]|nr:glutamate racemase [candidate division Zixibacteria bacterium]
MTAAAPIAIFDSGVGGLTVARELRRALANEEIIYLGDTARVPYGPKSAATVKRFGGECVEFLLHFRPKLVIIACNTASATALEDLDQIVDVPLLGVIEPGARAALGASNLRRIGVIGTRATITSGAYPRAVAALDKGATVFSRACPLFVPMVEEGRTKGPVVKAVAQEYLTPLLEQEIDTLILGCTHYPVLKSVMAEVVGAGVTLIDSAETMATAAKELLAARGEGRPESAETPKQHFYVTDVIDEFERVGRIIWPDMTGRIERVEIGRAALR